MKGAETVFLGGGKVASGHRLRPDPALGRGVNANPLGRLDRRLNNTPMVDLLGGIPDFSTTRVKVEPA